MSDTHKDFFAGICVGLQVLTACDEGVAWGELVRACDVNALLQYAAHIEPDEWELAGFKKYAAAELGKRKPAKRVCAPAADAAPVAQPVNVLKGVSRLEVIARRLDGCAQDISVCDGLSRQPTQLTRDANYLRKLAGASTVPTVVDAAPIESPMETMDRLTRQFDAMSDLERSIMSAFLKRASVSQDAVGEPVAWMYESANDEQASEFELTFARWDEPGRKGWVETPLFSRKARLEQTDWDAYSNWTIQNPNASKWAVWQAALYTAPAIPVADTVQQESESTAAYHPNEQAVRAACDLVDKLKGAYDHWEGWSGTPGTCDSIVNLLRYGHEDGAADAQRTDAEGLMDHAGPLLLNILWHHQGASSRIGQAVRALLGMGQHDHLSDVQVDEAKRVESILAARPASAKPVLSGDERIAKLEKALVYVAHSMHSEPQHMLAEGITLGDVSYVRVKVGDLDVSVQIPEAVARAMYASAHLTTEQKRVERSGIFEGAQGDGRES